MTQRSVLVTGATGFIGQQVLPLLSAKGFDVHGVSRQAVNSGESVTWHELSMFDRHGTDDLLRQLRPTHLLHLAWITVDDYYSNAENVRWLEHSLALFSAFAESGGSRFVGAGTSAEYDLRESADLTEYGSPLAPNGLYGASKKALYEVTSRYAEQISLGHAWARIFFCYGPGEAAARPIPTLLRRLYRGERVAFQEGRSLRDYVHVGDVASALATLVDTDANGAFNVGSGTAISLRDFVSRLAAAAAAGSVDFGAAPTPSYEPARVVANVTRLTQLGWSPRHSLDDGIRRTVEWWCERFAAGDPSG